MTTSPDPRSALPLLLSLWCGNTATQAQTGQVTPEQPAARATTRSVSTEVHEAWLQEVLDLDVKGAVKAYDTISKRAPRNQPERWLAVSRLAELRRLGIGPIEPGPEQPAPAAVRKALSELEAEPNLEQLLRSHDPDLQLPPLHPATQQVQDWVRNQIGPTVEERLRLHRLRLRNAPSGSPTERTERTDRIYAFDILRVELQNRHAQAQALRTLYFENWQPPTWQAEAAAQLALVEQRLQAWIEVETWTSQRILLAKLDAAIKQRAESAPELALAFVAQLPLYAEKLLAPEPEAADKVSPGPGTQTGDGVKNGPR